MHVVVVVINNDDLYLFSDLFSHLLCLCQLPFCSFCQLLLPFVQCPYFVLNTAPGPGFMVKVGYLGRATTQLVQLTIRFSKVRSDLLGSRGANHQSQS
jgi:hypothetical protein